MQIFFVGNNLNLPINHHIEIKYNQNYHVVHLEHNLYTNLVHYHYHHPIKMYLMLLHLLNQSMYQQYLENLHHFFFQLIIVYLYHLLLLLNLFHTLINNNFWQHHMFLFDQLLCTLQHQQCYIFTKSNKKLKNKNYQITKNKTGNRK